MNSGLLKIALCACVIAVVGCSTNTQNENTGIGAVTGAVAGGAGAAAWIGGPAAVAGGALVGGVIGGLIGHSMDSSDKNMMNHTMANNQANEPKTWVNKKTGARYKVVPTSEKVTYNGNPNCRNYYGTVTLHGKTQETSGTACLVNGKWVDVKKA